MVDKFPHHLDAPVRADVDASKRQATSSNHSAVHLMHAALHRILGAHALQKGQDVDDQRLRFDFSHFQKVNDEELLRIEQMVNQKIRENIPLEEQRNLPIEEAKKAGAMMLFGEKYGDAVRMITFDASFSRELCGGTHVSATGEIGLFKIVAESAVAAGIRRIEAVTAEHAEAYLRQELQELAEIRAIFKNAPNTIKQILNLQDENKALRKEIEKLQASQAGALKDDLKKQFQMVQGYHFLAVRVPVTDGAALASAGERTSSPAPQGAMVIASKESTETKGIHAVIWCANSPKPSTAAAACPFFATAGKRSGA